MADLIYVWERKGKGFKPELLPAVTRQSAQDRGHENLKVERNDWASAGIQQFGSVICIPKFGLISIMELLVEPSSNQLVTLRLYLEPPVESSLVLGSNFCFSELSRLDLKSLEIIH